MDRFWSKVNKSGECWTWTASSFKDGYGKFWLRGRNRYANRVSWELAYGVDPGGMMVCHSCDNPPCVRPEHLFLGTQKDNRRDAVAKGRTAKGARHGSRTKPHTVPRGERNGNAKLTYEIADAIREEYASGDISQWDLARRYGVAQTAISSVINRKTWNRKEFAHA